MSKNAFVLRRITDAGAGLHYPKSSVIEGMPEDQFESWKRAGIVREATEGELERKTPEPKPVAESDRALSTPPPPPAPPKAKRRRKAAE